MLEFALAQANDTSSSSSGGGGSLLTTIVPIVAIIALIYFFMIRPQNKRRKEAEQMRSDLGVGDEVETVGGLRATVASLGDGTVTLQASPGVELTFARGAIGRIVNSVHAGSSADDEADADDDAETKND